MFLDERVMLPSLKRSVTLVILRRRPCGTTLVLLDKRNVGLISFLFTVIFRCNIPEQKRLENSFVTHTKDYDYNYLKV